MILASGSPRRLEILQQHGITPVVLPSDVEETMPLPMCPSDLAMFLALKKALFVEAAIMNDPSLVPDTENVLLSADTIVTKNGLVFGKPKDVEDARFITSSLQGSTHYVITGACVMYPGTSKRRVFYEETGIVMDPIATEELESYILTDEPYDKAGGYAIQGTFGKYIKKIEGDLENVIGLPYEKTMTEIALL